MRLIAAASSFQTALRQTQANAYIAYGSRLSRDLAQFLRDEQSPLLEADGSRDHANLAMSSTPTLSYFDRIPPYAAFIAAELSGFALEAVPDHAATKDTVPMLKLPGGAVLEGIDVILKYIARSAAPEKAGLYGSSPLEACQIDQWIQFTSTHFVSGPGLEAAVASASSALALRTFVVGYSLTIADLAAWGALQSAPMWPKVRKLPSTQNLLRWFEFVSAQPAVAEQLGKRPTKASAIAAAATSSSTTAANKDVETRGVPNLTVELPNAVQGKVVTRFPPEPSGYLHIGHAKAALLNQHFAEKYGGKLLIRFDDTNPSKESEEFVDNIIDDMQRLGLTYEKITYTSDHFPHMVEIAKKLIRAGHMYADNTDVDTMREERLKCIESKARNMPAAEAERLFEEMLKGSEKGKPYCLRVRLDMSNANACLRDPVAYRCNDNPHWRTGTKHKCYPTYDFACPFADAFEGVTHALRTSEYRDREEQYQRILKLMQSVDKRLPNVQIWDFSRLNFVNTVLSKRKLQKLVDMGVVDGWTDPRFPTVQGILRRGMTLQGLREFIIAQGASRNTTLQEWDKIWSFNKKVIDPIAPRHTAVLKTRVVPITLSNGPAEVEYTTVPKHKKNPEVGVKTLFKGNRLLINQEDALAVKEGEEVTLMDWGNCILKAVHKDSSGKVTGIDGELHLEGDFKKTRLKLTWLCDVPDLVPLRVVDLGHLITKAKLEEEDDFEVHINRDSWHESAALGDANMRALQKGDIIQLERKGFYKVDQPMLKPDQPLLLFNVPDGHVKGKKGL